MKNHSNWSRLLLFLPLTAGVLIFQGCNDEESSPAASEEQLNVEDREDIADEFGRIVAGDEAGMMQSWQEMPGESEISQDSRGQSLDDTLIVTRDGFTMTRVRTFFDINGLVTALYIPGVTASMEQRLSIEGTRENPSGNRSVELQQHDTVMIDGLLPGAETMTINGDGARSVEGEFHSRFRQNVKTMDAAYEWGINDVMIHSNHAEYPYPLSGSIAVSAEWMSTHENPGRSVSHSGNADFTVMFDGTRYAELIFESGATFWIDLETGEPLRERPGGDA